MPDNNVPNDKTTDADTSNDEITVVDNPDASRYEAHLNGELAAFVTYRRAAGPHRVRAHRDARRVHRPWRREPSRALPCSTRLASRDYRSSRAVRTLPASSPSTPNIKTSCARTDGTRPQALADLCAQRAAASTSSSRASDNAGGRTMRSSRSARRARLTATMRRSHQQETGSTPESGLTLKKS